MIYLKSKEEIDKIAAAGAILSEVFLTLQLAIKPGVSTKELDEIANRVITAAGAKSAFKGYNGFPGNICTSVNKVLIHGVPGSQKLSDGDIISIDVGVDYQGYIADSAWTFPVGSISPEAAKLMAVTEEALYEGLKEVKEGNRVGDISNAIERYVESHGFTLPIEFCGHGVGRKLHEDPPIPNSGPKGQGPRLKAGMVLAIEPMVHQGTPEVDILSNQSVVTLDGRLSAHYEHTVVVEKDGCRILTQINMEDKKWPNRM